MFLGYTLTSFVMLAVAAPCRVPDTNSLIVTNCPIFQWERTPEGLHIPDRGELLWTDSVGDLFSSEKLNEVPEPFRSMYRARKSVAWHPPPLDAMADAYAPRATEILHQQRAWRQQIAGWRQELFTATRLLLEATLRPGALAHEPLAFAYAPHRVLLIEARGAARSEALSRLMRAQIMLQETLPRQAREQRVPMLWLQ